jgi:CheY-like chemotaxis protein
MVPTTPAQDTPVVLVAEDEALVRMMTVDVLEEAGCAVIEAASAEAALSVLDERSDHVCGLVSGPSGRARERRIEAVWWIGIGPFRAALLRWTGAAATIWFS